jgi:dipeptidyl aminopeptidase/acylaminoacyl peptidase
MDHGHRVRRTFVTGPGHEPTRVPEGWNVMAVTAPWGIALQRRAGRRKGASSPALAYAGLELANGRVHEIPLRPSRLPFTPEGSVLAISREGDGILAVPLDGGKPHRVLAGRVRTHSLSPDGASLLAATDRGVFLFAAAAPVAARLEGGPQPGSIRHIRWSRDGRWFLIAGPEGGWRGSTACNRLEPFSLPGPGRPIWFDGRRAVLEDRAARRLVLAYANGRARQLLPASP